MKGMRRRIVLSPDGSLALVTSAHFVRTTEVMEVMRTGTFGLWNTASGTLRPGGQGRPGDGRGLCP